MANPVASVTAGEVDPQRRVEGQRLRGSVVEAVGLPLPRVWIRCDLTDSTWPTEFDLTEVELVDCELSGSSWEGVRATDLRIVASQRGLTRAHGMSMRGSVLRGLTVVRLVGLRVDLSDAAVDDANVRRCTMPRLNAARLHGENAHFCTGTAMDESNWDGARLPGVCFSDASLIGASMRDGVFC